MTRSRLLWIKLEAFRGFAVEQEFDLDADVVLIRGDNGTGKTSLSDGLLWLCTGKIPRLTERAKGLRKAEDPVICRYRPNGPARVTLGIRLIDGTEVTFRREGGAGRSILSASRGDAEVDNAARLLAEALGLDKPDHVTEAVNTWGILQQHAMLAALARGRRFISVWRRWSALSTSPASQPRRPRRRSACAQNSGRLRPVRRDFVSAVLTQRSSSWPPAARQPRSDLDCPNY